MPRTNRSKKGKAKAGLTRNQAMKAERSNKQQTRLRETVSMMEHLTTKKDEDSTSTNSKRIRKPSMKGSAQNRRRNVIARNLSTIHQLRAGGKPSEESQQIIDRLLRENKKLESRVR